MDEVTGLTRLRTLAEAATSGEWHAYKGEVYPPNPGMHLIYCVTQQRDIGPGYLWPLPNGSEADAAFIAAANPAVVLGLLELIEQAREMLTTDNTYDPTEWLAKVETP